MPLVNVLINSTTAGVGSGRVQRGNAPPPIFLDYLAVGGGGYSTTAAGGGGGVVSGSIRFLPRFTLDVTVGVGGIGTTSSPASASVIQSTPNEFFVYAGGGYVGASGQPQNNPAGTSTSNYSQPGAGGSAQSGSSPAGDSIGGAGGSGSVWLDGNTYAGGGGGRGGFFIPGSAVGGAGGQGGGGNGQGFTTAAADGTANTGGGGGGTSLTPTNGGSGIVKMRYISGSVSGATGGTITSVDGYTYHTFTGSGQFVYQP